MFHANRANFLNDQLLKNRSSSSQRRGRKFSCWKQDLSDSSCQAELWGKLKYEARTSTTCMILVMDINLSMLYKTIHTSSGDGSGSFGYVLDNGIISGLGTCANSRKCSNISKILHFSSSFSLWWISIFLKWIN